MVKSTRKGKMSKKRAGTRKIKGGASTTHLSPKKSLFGSFVSSFTPKPSSTSFIDNSNIYIKKRHTGGMSCGTKKHDKKSKKGGTKRVYREVAAVGPGGGKKHGGFALGPGGGKKHGGKKHGGKKHGTKKKSMKGGGFWANTFTPPL